MKKLSAQQLACGYVQLAEGNDYRLTMWMEHGTYHVRLHNHAPDYRVAGRCMWESFRTMTEARHCFDVTRRCYRLEIVS